MTIPQLLADAIRAWDDPRLLTELADELETRSRLDEAFLLAGRATHLQPSERPYAWLTQAWCAFRDARANRDNEAKDILNTAWKATHHPLIGAWMYVMEACDSKALPPREELEQAIAGEDRLCLPTLYSWNGDEDRSMQYMIETAPMVHHCRERYPLMAWIGTAMHAGIRGTLPRDVNLEEAFNVVEAMAADRAATRRHRPLYAIMGKRYDEAAALLADVLTMVPDDETLMFWKGRCHHEGGDLSLAEEWYYRAIGAKPSYVEARLALAKLQEAQGRPSNAIATLAELAHANTGYALGLMHAAVILDRLGEHAMARQYAGLAAPKLSGWMAERARANEAMTRLLASLATP